MSQMLSAVVALSLFVLSVVSVFQFLPLIVWRWISWISTFRQ